MRALKRLDHGVAVNLGWMKKNVNVCCADLSGDGPKPWQWNKDWTRNEFAFLKFLAPIALSLNLVLSAKRIAHSAGTTCSSLKTFWSTFR